MKKQVTLKVKSLKDPLTKEDYGYVPGTPEERIALMWKLSQEIASLSGKYDVEQRLQRHITKLLKRKR